MMRFDFSRGGIKQMQKHTLPLVSIIIPVFNVAEYLNECLESVFNQTYPNIELIVINDGSTDDSSIILEKWKLKNEFILITQKNSGQSISRNKGLKVAKGKYILFVDSDDYIDVNTIDVLVKKIENDTSDIIRFNALPFKHNSKKIMKNKNYDFSSILIDNKVYEGKELKYIFESFSSSPCLYMFKKDLVTSNNIYFTPNIIHEDELFTINLFFAAKRFSYTDNFFYYRRYRDFSTMTRRDKEHIIKSFDSYIYILKELEKVLENNKITPVKRRFIEDKINSIFRAIYFYDLDENYKRKKMNTIKEIDYKEHLVLLYMGLQKQLLKFLKKVRSLKENF